MFHLKTKLITLLALIGAVVLAGLGSAVAQGDPAAAAGTEPGKLLEVHSLKGRPAVRIYMKGFTDMAFSAYLQEGDSRKLLFASLPCLKSQFESTTNVLVRGRRAHRFSAAGVGQYDLFWSADSQRLALAFEGNYIAGYDCRTGQKIQVRDGLDTKLQCRALGAVIGSFLEGKAFTDAEVAAVRQHSYSAKPPETTP